VLYSFGSQNIDGVQPSSGLVMDTKGNLYGTTEFGGANQTGTVFELPRLLAVAGPRPSSTHSVVRAKAADNFPPPA
jgi:uncharacterized repeat protein (TIGR03803 family)